MNVELITIPGCPGGTALPGPSRFGIHSTEGSWEGSISAYTANGSAPHLQLQLPSTGGFRLAKFIPFDRSAYSFRNESGGVETNRLGHVIQMEIVMFAEKAGNLKDEDYRAIGEVIRWVSEQVPGMNLAHFHKTLPYPESYGNNGIRMSADHWSDCNGIFCHMHVPENDHGDPGAVDMQKVSEYALDKEWSMAAEEKLDQLIAATKRQTTAIISQGQKSRKADLNREIREAKRRGEDHQELLDELEEIEQEIAQDKEVDDA